MIVLETQLRRWYVAVIAFDAATGDVLWQQEGAQSVTATTV